MDLDIDVSNPRLFFEGTIHRCFQFLRQQAPVHFKKAGFCGDFWSITKHSDIKAFELNHRIFSSDIAYGGVTISDTKMLERLPMFIAKDPPEHTEQRQVVQPVFLKEGVAALEAVVRESTKAVLNELPTRFEFDWVDIVSKKLTARVLSILLGTPAGDDELLNRWIDVATHVPSEGGGGMSATEYRDMLGKCLAYFRGLSRSRRRTPLQNNVCSRIAHSSLFSQMDHKEFLGNILLFLIGGSDTTSSALTGCAVKILNDPKLCSALRDDPGALQRASMEIIRWQTPLAHMRRTALVDYEYKSRLIRAGDKVVLWYLSGNYDEDIFNKPEEILLDRENGRQHLSFGFGVHRCIGSRLADLQIRILLEEFVQRYEGLRLCSPPVKLHSNFVHGYSSASVRLWT